jgi:hypothetical protein
MWITVLAVVISVLSLGLSIYTFIVQWQMKKADVFESRWFRLLDHLKSFIFPPSNPLELDWVGEMCLRIGIANMQGDPTLREIAEQITGPSAERINHGATPEGLYGAFQSLAVLREEKPSDKRHFLDQSLSAYLSSKHITHALYHAFRHEDGKTIMFLIEIGLLAKFAPPYLQDHIETLRKACGVRPRESES